MNYETFKSALYTDYYELTMAQGYFLTGRKNDTAVFDYFFRSNPYESGYVVFCGLTDFLNILSNFTFDEDELEYLKEEGFKDSFLEFLRAFKFEGTIYSAHEGEVVFPNETVLRVEGNIIETQILESLLLNILNFQSLIATKASRLRYAAEGKTVLDFGLRRAQGFGSIHATRAAVVGGVDGTSNVYSAYRYGLPAGGTMAHSWVQSFDSELESFRRFAKHYPDNCILLVDTYNTLESGVPNAIKVAKELEEDGHRLAGIRLDSGDLAYFAKQSRNMLDGEGLDYVKIAASNQLDERVIRSLKSQNAPIDIFGVGTRLVTGHESAALDGVYKLAQTNSEPKLKVSENIEKITLPGKKMVHRYYNGDGYLYADGIAMDDESAPEMIYHPNYPAKKSRVSNYESKPLLHPKVENGKTTVEPGNVQDSAKYCRQAISELQPEYKRFENPHIFKVGVSKKLLDTRSELIEKVKP